MMSSDDVSLSASAVASLHLVNVYTGTATLQADLTVGTLDLTSGASSQWTGSATKDLTVTTAVTWTGGTLNSSAHAATATLGGTVSIDPGGGSIATGDNLAFQDATATVAGGTVTFNNDTSF